MSGGSSREMSLVEWVGKLAKGHRAVREHSDLVSHRDRLVEALRIAAHALELGAGHESAQRHAAQAARALLAEVDHVAGR